MVGVAEGVTVDWYVKTQFALLDVYGENIYPQGASPTV